MEVYVGIEGFTLSKETIVKELVILYPNKEYNHYLFKNPSKLLSSKDSQTVRYTTKYINKLSWYDGDVLYSNVGQVLKKVRDWKIYTYGSAARKFLAKYLPNSVIIDIQPDTGKMPSVLEPCGCFRDHPTRYCAKAKALYIKDTVDNHF